MKIPTTKPHFPKEDIKRILKDTETILKSGRLYNGPFIKKFEETFAKEVGTKYAVAVNSGTTALQIILEYYGVKKREVITPTNTFIATSNAVLFAGGTPVLADMDPETLCLDLKDIEKQITKRTKGIILVHINGFITPKIRAIQKLCRKHKLFLIEDASHAHGACFESKMAGSWGDAAAFSCLATKPLTTGGVGGILTTNDKKLDAFARSLRFHGEDKERGVQNRLGNDWFMSELQAAVGYWQTKRLKEMVRKRMAIARTYDKAFARLPHIKTFDLPKNSLCSYYKYPLLLEKPLKKEIIAKKLKEAGVATGSLYSPPCHLQPVYKKLFKYKKGDLPVAEDILNRTITLPMYAGMTRKETRYVITQMKKCVE